MHPVATLVLETSERPKTALPKLYLVVWDLIILLSLRPVPFCRASGYWARSREGIGRKKRRDLLASSGNQPAIVGEKGSCSVHFDIKIEILQLSGKTWSRPLALNALYIFLVPVKPSAVRPLIY